MSTYTETSKVSTRKNSTPKNSVPKEATPKSSRSIKSTSKHPFPISASSMSGFKVTLRATLEILSELHANHGCEYLLTSCLTQDNLERLFSIMRYCCGADDHPTPQQFGKVFCLYCCNAMMKPPKDSNMTGVELLQTLIKTKYSLEMSRQPRMEWLKKIDQMIENAVPLDKIWIDNSSNNVNDSAISVKELNDATYRSTIALENSDSVTY